MGFELEPPTPSGGHEWSPQQPSWGCLALLDLFGLGSFRQLICNKYQHCFSMNPMSQTFAHHCNLFRGRGGSDHATSCWDGLPVRTWGDIEGAICLHVGGTLSNRMREGVRTIPRTGDGWHFFDAAGLHKPHARGRGSSGSPIAPKVAPWRGDSEKRHLFSVWRGPDSSMAGNTEQRHTACFKIC